MSLLERSLTMTRGEDGTCHALASPDYEAGNGMFGGWTAALMLKSVLDDPAAEGSTSAITVNFIKQVTPGSALRLVPKRLGGGRSLIHWRCDLFDDAGDPLATATIVLANRKASDAYTQGSMPEAAGPGGLVPAQLPGTFAARVSVLPTMGDDLFNQTTTRSINWEKETSGRSIDAVQIALVADLGAPRVFFISAGPRPSSTITMSVYFHATTDELVGCGDDYILSDMIGTRIEGATTGSRKDMWSRGGKLLATTEQMCWFR